MKNLERRSKPSCMSQKIFDNDLNVIRNSKITLSLNKPAYVGMCILDLSKVYGNKLKLLFTNTDILMYEIKTKDVYADFSKNKKCLILVII